MAKIDEVKEEINFLKVWLSILIMTVLGMIGWGIVNINKVSKLILILDVIGIVILLIIVVIINITIIKKNKKLEGFVMEILFAIVLIFVIITIAYSSFKATKI